MRQCSERSGDVQHVLEVQRSGDHLDVGLGRPAHGIDANSYAASCSPATAAHVIDVASEVPACRASSVFCRRGELESEGAANIADYAELQSFRWRP